MKQLLALVVLLAAGCGGNFSYTQVAPKNPDIAYTWTASAGCASCSYVISVLTVANGTTVCPSSSGTKYTPLNESAPVSGTNYIYVSATPGTSVCAVAQAYDGLYSGASSPSKVIVVPIAPGAPGAPNGTPEN